MTQWMRQHRESLLYRMPWHIEDPWPTRARELGLLLMMCGTTTAADDRGIDYIDDPPLDDRCPSVSWRVRSGRGRLAEPERPGPSLLTAC